jgi:hypothetical protein
MSPDGHVQGLEVPWEDSLAFDELSEAWRDHRLVAEIEDSDSDDSNYASMPLLIDDGVVVDDDGQRSVDHALLFDSDHFEGLVAQEGFAFGSALSPQQALWVWEEHCANLTQEEFGLSWVVHPQIASVIYRVGTRHSWLVPQGLPLGILGDLEYSRCGQCFRGPERVSVYSLSGVSIFTTGRDGAGVTDRRIRIRERCYEWRSVCIFAASSLRYLFGRGGSLIVLVLDLNGPTFYKGSCRCSNGSR